MCALKCLIECSNGKIPVKSHLSLGLTMPMLGLTQYFLGEVVFTCELCCDIGIRFIWFWLLDRKERGECKKAP